MFTERLLDIPDIARIYFASHSTISNQAFAEMVREDRNLELWSCYDGIQLAIADIHLHSLTDYSGNWVKSALEAAHREMGLFKADYEYIWLGTMHHLGSYGSGAYIYPLARRIASMIMSSSDGIATFRANVLRNGGLLEAYKSCLLDPGRA